MVGLEFRVAPVARAPAPARCHARRETDVWRLLRACAELLAMRWARDRRLATFGACVPCVCRPAVGFAGSGRTPAERMCVIPRSLRDPGMTHTSIRPRAPRRQIHPREVTRCSRSSASTGLPVGRSCSPTPIRTRTSLIPALSGQRAPQARPTSARHGSTRGRSCKASRMVARAVGCSLPTAVSSLVAAGTGSGAGHGAS